MIFVGLRLVLFLFIFAIGVEFEKVNGHNVDGTHDKFRSKKTYNHGILNHTPNIALHSGIVGGFVPNHFHRRDLKDITGIIVNAIKSDDLYRDYHAKRGMESKESSTRRRGSSSHYKKYGRKIFYPLQIKRNKVANMHPLRSRKRSSTNSPLSSTTAIMRSSDRYHRSSNWQWFQNIVRGLQSKMEKIEAFDAAIIVTYACTQIAITLPVILIPVIAADPFAPNALSSMDPVIGSAAFVGKLVSLGSMGLGTGKLLNGFICQAIGGRVAGSVYLLGMGAFALFLSMTSSAHAYAIAGMEFCASMMWTASLVLLSSRYSHDTKKFGAAMMSLSLASTSGTMISKFLGGALLSQFHWRHVALFATIFSIIGSTLFYMFTKEEEGKDQSKERQVFLSTKSTGELVNAGPSLKSIESSIRSVLFKGPIFWCVTFAHFTSYIVRSSDKILGSCLVDVANVPPAIAGMLTLSITLGFVIGLLSGQKVLDMDSSAEKQSFIFKRYMGAALAAVTIAFSATDVAVSVVGPIGIVMSITLASCCMACCAGFQFYQIPAIHSTSYGINKPVFISLCDAFGCLALSPFWSSVSGVVASNSNGWTISWLAVSCFIALGGIIMTSNLPTVMGLDEAV